MKYERTHDRLIYEQAARWHLRMQGNPTLQQRSEFDQWLMESRRHIRNYLLVVALDRELGQMDSSSLPRDRFSSASIDPIVSLSERTADGAQASARERRWALPLAAAALVLIVSGLFLKPWQWIGGYATQVGEQRIVKLDDGSVMHLNTRSRAQVSYSSATREIHLLSGEASFVVARDPARPFRVETGSATIQALGTEFNVYRRGKRTAVSVVEGRVQVLTNELPLPLTAGEAADVQDDGHITKRSSPNITSTVAWRERRLVFRENSLADIASEFNRYNETPRVRVDGGDAAARKYSGIFDAYDPNSLAEVLKADDELLVERSRSEIVVRKR